MRYDNPGLYSYLCVVKRIKERRRERKKKIIEKQIYKNAGIF